MRAAAPPLAAVASLMIISLALLIASETVEGIPRVVEFEKDVNFISVSPVDTATTVLNATIRSPLTSGYLFVLTAEIPGEELWSVDHPRELYLDALEQRSVEITVSAPHGETGGKRVTLELTVGPEGDDRQWSDRTEVEVLPYLWADLEPKEPYLLDMPLEGEFVINLTNSGTASGPSRIGIIAGDAGGDTVQLDEYLLSMGGMESISVPYEMDPDLDEYEISLDTRMGGSIVGHGLDVRFIRELDRVHILFRIRPVLILTKGPEDLLRLRAIGGDVEDIQLKILAGPDGSYVRNWETAEVMHLGAEEFEVEIAGYTGKGLITVRAEGTHEGKTVMSNPVVLVRSIRTANEGGISPITAVGVGGGSIAVLGLGTLAYLYSASEAWKYRLLTLLFIPLYSTVKGEKVLDHFFRGRLYQHIKENPGITYSGLKRHFDVNNGVLTYHLHRLENEELIAYKNVGKYKLFYAEGIRMRGGEIVLSQMDKRILELIHRTPGITAREIMNLFRGERAQRTLSRHLKDLERKGLVEAQNDGGRRRLFMAVDWVEAQRMIN